MALPKLTLEEKLGALKKAQEVRSRRAQIRQSLKQGAIQLSNLLASPCDEVVARMRVAYLLESLPRMGRVRSRKIMEEVGIHESRRVQGLGARQRDALLKRLAR